MKKAIKQGLGFIILCGFLTSSHAYFSCCRAFNGNLKQIQQKITQKNVTPNQEKNQQTDSTTASGQSDSTTTSDGQNAPTAEIRLFVPDCYFMIGEEEDLKPYQKLLPGLIWGALVDLENITNLHGGLQRGSVPDASGNIGILFDTCKAHLWWGGQFTAIVNGMWTDGFEPDLAGEVQTVSNLWTLSAVRFSELAYRQQFNDYFDIRGGILDLTFFFDISREAAGLMNYAFSTTLTLFQNAFISTGPYWGLGVIAEYVKPEVSAKIAIFQSNPREINTAFREGYLIIGEYARVLQKSIILRGGIWRINQTDPTLGNKTQGVYGIAEREWRFGGKTLGAFISLGASPQSTNPIPYQVSIGMNAHGVLPCRSDDIFSAGFSRDWVLDSPSELIYEVTYAVQVNDVLVIQPDLQYVANPAYGTRNAWMGLIRAHLDFS